MDFRIKKPSTSLAPFVKLYWMVENTNRDNSYHTQRIVPTGLADISFYEGIRPSTSDERKSISGFSVVSGQCKNYYDITLSGELTVFSVYFFPHTLSLFIDIPLNEINNYSIPLKDLIPDAGRLEEDISAANSFKEKVKIIETFLLNRLTQHKNNLQIRRISHAINMINHSKGNLSIDLMASETCLSRKQFERIFKQHVGNSPKQFLKTIRFQNAINIREETKSTSLTELAFECGYYDQSHMISDFIKFSGKTPREYFKEAQAISDYFQY